MIVQCCVCKKVRQRDESWRALEQALPDKAAVSHGYCPVCAAKAFDEIADYVSAANAKERSRMYSAA
ncbi:MAG: hypothetical protein GY851_19565 [bacterium]|nr:hypothetical protein [bacterium]